jgi:DNA-3-methyladenine glycosylase I
MAEDSKEAYEKREKKRKESEVIDDGIQRCFWATKDQQEADYHDSEWGVPLHDDKKLFEFLLLENFQAGLTWKMILHRREGFRKAFDNFNYRKIACYKKPKIEALLQDESIIRNKLKIRAAVTNAQAFIGIRQEFGSFDKYIWQFTNGESIVNNWNHHKDIPTQTEISDAMSIDLKNRGFKFVGSVICYAFMQAIGMVNDHTTDCFRYGKVQ